MYTLLFQVILLVLPSFGFALPAQPTLPLDSVATGNDTLNADPVGDIDPRFEIEARYEQVPIDEDQCLVEAVQVLEVWAQTPPTDPVVEASYQVGDLPNIYVAALGPGGGRPIQVRFLTWGLYLGIKGMIETRNFKKVFFFLRWERQLVGFIAIGKPEARLSLSGDNSTSDLQQKSSSDSLSLVASQGLNRDSFNLSVPDTLSDQNMQMRLNVLGLGQPLPKYDAIMAIMKVVFSASLPGSHERIQDPVQIAAPPPFEAKLQVRPERRTSEPPYVTGRMVSAVTSQIPVFLLLQARQWAEVKYQIEIDDVLVATCWLKNGRAGLEFGQSRVS